MRSLVLAFVLCVPAFAMAQGDPACDAANAVLGALFKGKANVCKDRPAAPPAPTATTATTGQASPAAGFTRRDRDVDTPENQALLASRVQARFAEADPMASPPPEPYLVCREEMTPLRPMENIIGSNYERLQQKCLDMANAENSQYLERRRTAATKAREEAATQRAQREAAEKQKEEAEIKAAVAELRSGKREAKNCAQWMIAKGHEIAAIDRGIDRVSLEPVRGVGKFAGAVELIDGRSLILADGGASNRWFTVVNLDGQTKVFQGDAIRSSTLVYGYGTQTGSRNLRLASGAASTAAVIQVACLQPVL